ncbi:hypothetical protein Sulku_2776 (plasmid) [Sulfuricurvum kujiense DSM 16994]|uniref:DUF1311 domain-containing protein n=1 Tax=Sulfuricurvum kujiense (strain ATCC BAA-921 / DSM 16994 / JCM 11577 / YK-1) TaxID=709032 RepID=E4U409_SULKY|nr:DUF1311 domain-containing protein [Sulfuricurvum kujiense]ADR35425.1 hypothetical protein Sulku_2776 [Sulfuricurvum kujiense DSM 16994]
MNKNVIEYIQEIKSRQRFKYIYGEFHGRISDMRSAFNVLPHKEFLRYFPLSLVALLETSCRMLIAELIDSGEPYISRSKELMDKQKIDFEVMKHLYGKKITMGEFIAHSVAINKLESIDRIFTTLLDKKLLQVLPSHINRWSVEVEKKDPQPMIQNSVEMYTCIKEIFEIRHILAHESAMNIELENVKIEQAIVLFGEFLEVLNDYIRDVMYPDQPLTQMDMNMSACDDLTKTLDSIEAIDSEIVRQISDKWIERLEYYKRAHESWKKYMEDNSEFEASSFIGGSMWTLIKASSANRIALEREKDLKLLLNQLEENDFC